MPETVLTSRRARLRIRTGTVAVRLRLSDVELRLETARGTAVVLPLGTVTAVRLVRRPRLALEVRTDAERVRFRCFAPAAVLRLIEGARPPQP